MAVEPVKVPIEAAGLEALNSLLSQMKAIATSSFGALDKIVETTRQLTEMGVAGAKTLKVQADATLQLARAQTEEAKAAKLAAETALVEARTRRMVDDAVKKVVASEKELEKAHLAALSPAERYREVQEKRIETARKLGAETEKLADIEKRSAAIYADKARREKENAGRSLSTLFDQQNAKIEDFTRSITGSFGPLGNMVQGLIDGRKAYTEMAEQAQKAGTSIGSALVDNVGKGNLAMLAIAGTAAAAVTSFVAAGAAIYSMSMQAYEAIDQISDMADRIGVSAVTLSRFREVSLLTDVSMQTLGNGFKILSKSIFEAQTAGSEQAKVFEALGITGKENEEVFLQVADVIAGLTSETERVAVAQKLFGRAGNELLPVLSMGSAKIREMMKANDELGLTLNEKTIKAAGDFEVASKKLDLTITALKETIGVKFLPMLTQLAEKFTNLIDPMRKYMQAANEANKTAADRLKEQIDNAKKMDFSGLRTGVKIQIDMTSQTKNAAQAIADLEAKQKAAAEAQKERERRKRESAQRAMEDWKRDLENRKQSNEYLADAAQAQEALNYKQGVELKLREQGDALLRKELKRLFEVQDAIYQITPLSEVLAPPSLTERILTRVRPAFAAVRAEVESFATVAAPIIERIGNVGSAIASGVSSVFGMAKAGVTGLLGWVNQLVNLAGGAGPNFAAALSKIDLGKMIASAAQGLADTLGTVLAQSDRLIDGLAQGAFKALGIVVDKIGPIIIKLAGALIEGVVQYGPRLIAQLATGISSLLIMLAQDFIPALVAALPTLITALLDTLPDLLPAIVYLALAIVETVIANMPMIIAAIVKGLPALAEGLARAVGALVIGLVAMLLDAIGLDSLAGKLQKSADSLAGATTTTALTGTVNSGGKASSGTGVNDYGSAVTSSPSDGVVQASTRKQYVPMMPGDQAYLAQQGGPGDLGALLRTANAQRARASQERARMIELLESIAAKLPGGGTRVVTVPAASTSRSG